jgi:hypothetical protein
MANAYLWRFPQTIVVLADAFVQLPSENSAATTIAVQPKTPVALA